MGSRDEKERALFGGKWALVTGASSGIGKELAKGLAQRGAHLALAARSEDKLKELAAELESAHGVRTHVFRVDLSRSGAGRELFRWVSEAGIEVEHLVNNAGVG